MDFTKLMFVTLLVVPNLGFATAMSPEKSMCLGKESLARDHASWKRDFNKFLKDYDKLDPETRFALMNNSLNKVLKRMNDLKKETSIKPPNEDVTKDALRLYDAIHSGGITHTAASEVLRPGLGKLSDELDDMLFKAQVQNPNCDLVPGSPEGQQRVEATGAAAAS